MTSDRVGEAFDEWADTREFWVDGDVSGLDIFAAGWAARDAAVRAGEQRSDADGRPVMTSDAREGHLEVSEYQVGPFEFVHRPDMKSPWKITFSFPGQLFGRGDTPQAAVEDIKRNFRILVDHFLGLLEQRQVQDDAFRQATRTVIEVNGEALEGLKDA